MLFLAGQTAHSGPGTPGQSGKKVRNHLRNVTESLRNVKNVVHRACPRTTALCTARGVYLAVLESPSVNTYGIN